MSPVKEKHALLQRCWDDCGFRQFEDPEINEQLIEEVLYAEEPPPHEGHEPPYGALIVSSKQNRILMSEPQSHIDLALEDARPLADGNFSFVVRCGEASHLRMFKHGFGTEYGAFYIRDEFLKPFSVFESPAWDIAVIQRTEAGDVRVLGPRNIVVGTNTRWSMKEYKYAHVHSIHLSGRLYGEEALTVREAASLCVHGLSASRIGATVVIKRTDGPFEDIRTDFEDCKFITANDFCLDDQRWHHALVQLLSQKDGALLVRRTGEIEAIGANLCVPDDARCASSRGARHNSARKYSYAHPDCILMVVSATDGRVSVFMAGGRVLPLDPMAGDSRDRRRGAEFPHITCDYCSAQLCVETGLSEGGPCCPCCEQRMSGDAVDGHVVRMWCPVGA